MDADTDSPKRQFPFLALLVFLHIAFAATYAFIIPYRTAGTLADGPHQDIGAPDENAHANYIEHIIKGELPVFQPTAEGNGQDYEVHQPPLYYVLEAGANKAMGFGQTGSRTSGVAMRLLNALFGGAAVAGVYFFCFWAGGGRNLSLIGAGIVALLPMFCAVSGTLNNDALLACLCTWTAALCVKNYDGWTWRGAVLIGIFTGLALWTKATALILLPVVTFAFLYSRTEKRKIGLLAIALLIPLALILPWWIRNSQLYHDPLALGVFQKAFKPTVTLDQLNEASGRPLLHWAYVLLGGSVYSFVGEFGYMDISFPKWVYVPTLIVFIPGLLAGMFWKSNKTGARGTSTFLFLFALAAYVQFNLTYVQPQARYLFPAIAAISFWVALGLKRLLKDRAIWVGAGLLVWLALINAYAFVTLPKEYNSREAIAATHP